LSNIQLQDVSDLAGQSSGSSLIVIV